MSISIKKEFFLMKSIPDDDKPIVVSMSGGETSGDMYIRIRKNYPLRKIICVFANTGHEDERTLEFVHNIELTYGEVVWVEAVIDPRYGKGVRHRIVDFYTAARDTDKETPFEALIRKLGIPNKDNHHCTRDLKTRPIENYLKSIGVTDYHLAIGIRADEWTRLTNPNVFYEPAISGITKKDVNENWRARPFRLGLKGYEGNCKFCHKKTLRKLLTLMVRLPNWFDFPRRMERLYGGYVNPVRRKKVEAKGVLIHLPIRFYRGNRSVGDLEKLAENFTDFYHDENEVYNEETYNDELDGHEGDCSESCEAFTNFKLKC